MSSYLEGIIMLSGINLIADLGLSLLTGFAGLFSFGHAGFMAIGAYSAAILISTMKVTNLLAVFGVGLGLSALVAAFLGFLAIRSARQVLRVPREALMPTILMFCAVGSFAINNTVFGVTVMLIMGVLAYVMEENHIPVAPAILGIVLGPMLEDNFLTSMIKSDGRIVDFFERPIAGTLGVVTLLVWLIPLVLAIRRRLKAA